MARKFLYFIAVCIVLVILGAIALSIWSREATEIAFVPRGEFVEQEPFAENAYQDPNMWYSRPGLGTNDPSRYQPAIAETAPDPADQDPSPQAPAAEQSLDAGNPLQTTGTVTGEAADPQTLPEFAVFFVPPTSYIQAGGDWNSKIDDATTNNRARIFLQGLASPFNRADAQIPAGGRRGLPDRQARSAAGHRCGLCRCRPGLRLFHRQRGRKQTDRTSRAQPGRFPCSAATTGKGSRNAARCIAAVYAPGWPVSVEHDLPALPFPACASAGQAQCLLAWSAFSDDGDADLIMRRYEATVGYDGQPRGTGPILCVNPLTGATGGSAPASANLGTLIPDQNLSKGELVAGVVSARCGENGLLYIGDPPELGQGVLPGGNYHVYDIPLFWKNLQEDVVTRVKAWTAAQAS